MGSKALIALVAAVVAVAIVFAGCGGGGDGTEASSLTKAQFLKQGNAICQKGNETIEKDFEEFGKEHNFSENKTPPKAVLEEAIETVVIPQVQQQIDDIRALGAPSGGSEEVEAILSAAQKGLEEAEENPSVLIREEGANPLIKANKLSREYGLTKCGEE